MLLWTDFPSESKIIIGDLYSVRLDLGVVGVPR